jgi:NAD(P)-dependent dehydrogenase (short-subunit alcohol dehydrogenase family)
VTKESAVGSLVESISSQEGGLDYPFANAGVSGPITLAETGHEERWSVLDVDLNGVFLSVHKSLPLLERGREPSHVVVVSSVDGRKAKPMIPYHTSKVTAITLTGVLQPN